MHQHGVEGAGQLAQASQGGEQRPKQLEPNLQPVESCECVLRLVTTCPEKPKCKLAPKHLELASDQASLWHWGYLVPAPLTCYDPKQIPSPLGASGISYEAGANDLDLAACASTLGCCATRIHWANQELSPRPWKLGESYSDTSSVHTSCRGPTSSPIVPETSDLSPAKPPPSDEGFPTCSPGLCGPAGSVDAPSRLKLSRMMIIHKADTPV